MTERLRQILDSIHCYNTADLARINFGLDKDTEYDMLVVAPSYAPEKVVRDGSFDVTLLGSQSYCAGYLVERDGLKIAWIKTAAGGCNMLDYLLICGELKFKRLVFLGAVGALKAEFNIGDICTPIYSVAGTLANTYLKESLRDYVPFEQIYPDEGYVNRVVTSAEKLGYTIKRASVFCTDSISMEYSLLDEICSFGTDLIEMETSVFYAVAELMDIPAVALLVVSDNSATGVPLVGRSEEQQNIYENSRSVILPKLIQMIAEI